MPDQDWQEHLDSATRPARGEPPRAEARTVPGLTIGWHPDRRRIGEVAALPELASGRAVEVSRLVPLFAAPREARPRPLADPHLSRRPLRLRPEAGGAIRLDRRGTTTTVFADSAPIEAERSFTAEEIDRGVVLLLAEQVVLVLHPVLPSPPVRAPSGMVGESPALLDALQAIRAAADLPVPVLLCGESGTGKELAARALHEAGPRRSGPFVAVNMAAIPDSLSAAELFGAVKGAFTGADRQRRGYFRRAERGTLFLDEVGEMAPTVQTSLLRVLESGEIQPVGSEVPHRVDVRVVAATDADLAAAVAAGRFRAPLLHRLGGFEIRLPPLRERRDDVGRLLLHFLTLELQATGEGDKLDRTGAENDDPPWFPAALAARLAAHSWPGNVRQLRNVVRRLVVGSRGAPRITYDPTLERLLDEDEDRPGRPAAGSTAAGPPRAAAVPVYRRPATVSCDELLEALRANRWRFLPTAALLGISRTSLYALVDRCPGVRRPRDLSRAEIERCRRRCSGDVEAMVDELKVSRKGLRRRMTELGIR